MSSLRLRSQAIFIIIVTYTSELTPHIASDNDITLPPPSSAMVPSEVESTLSTAHSTNFLNRVKRDIAFRRDHREIESQATPVTPDTTKL